MFNGISNLFGNVWFRAIHRSWKPFSRLLLVPDAGIWSVAWDMIEVGAIAAKLGARPLVGAQGRKAVRQSVFFGSQFELLLTPRYFESTNRLATAYFHGKPGTGVAEFDTCFKNLVEHHERIDRIQVTHGEMRDLILSSGIDKSKVFLIPIGINLSYFTVQTPESRRAAREKLGLPASATVVGSFQKDGVGWGDGAEPKRIKGPDVLLKVLRELKERVPDLFVLLSGPARGYVKAGLTAMGVPFVHHYLADYRLIGEMYQALDAYVVTSRQEGGPKAILESMASGVPIITTRVGQATELMEHGVNGWIVDVDDVAGLAHWTEEALRRPASVQSVLQRGVKTAQDNSYAAQPALWKPFLQGFVTF